MMKKKLLLTTIFALLLVATLVLVACDFTIGDDDGWGKVFNYQTAYAEAQELGYTGTLEDFLASITGKDGADGKDGVGIKSVMVNSESHLIVTLSNDIIVDCGIVKGEKGDTGEDGQDGTDGVTPQLKIGEDDFWYVSYDNGSTWTCLNVKATGTDGEQGEQGQQGEQGVSIVSTTFDKNGNTVITYSDGSTQIVEHNWQKSFVLVEANCITDGKELYSCSDCGLVRIVTTSKTDHAYTETVVDPTCTTQGYTLHTCSVCGDSYTDNYTNATNEHNFKDSNNCKYCNTAIADIAVDSYNMSATSADNVCCYIVSRADGNNDVYMKGSGNMKDYTFSDSPLYTGGYSNKVVNAYIANGVKNIGACSFYNCGLANIEIAESVTSIGEHAFYCCENLTNIEIPKNVASIGHASFYACSSLSNITIPSNVTTIGEWTFHGCSSLTSVTFEAPSDWYCTQAENATSGITLTLTDVSQNATYLNTTYSCYCWCKASSEETSAESNVTKESLLASVVTIPVAGAEYNLALWQGTNATALYALATMDGNYIDTTEDVSAAAVAKLEATTGGYFIKLDDKYITFTGYWNGSYVKATISLEDTATTVFTIGTHNEFTSTVSVDIEGSTETCDFSLGSYSIYTNISADNTLYINDNSADVSQYLVHIIPKAKGGSAGNCNVEWVTDIQPTCTTQGSKHQVCSVCGNVLKIQSIDATGHDLTTTIIEPTHVEKGYTLHECHCGYSYKDTYIEANKEHNFKESNNCKYCNIAIADVAVASYNMSATSNDNVCGYVIPRIDGEFDVYIKGTGAIKDYSKSPFTEDGYKLVNAYIENGITQIGELTFFGTELANVDMPNTLTKIGQFAFAETNLTDVTIPDSLSQVDDYAFAQSALKTVTIPNSIVRIGQGAFNLTNLSSITIPGSVTVIDHYAFHETNLESIVIPANVVKIGSGAFGECENLANITINGTPQIGNGAFGATAYSDNPSNWQDSMLYIGNCLVDSCANCESFLLKEGTTVIASGAFNYCNQLTNITIPDSVISIGTDVFSNCPNIESISVSPNNTNYHSNGNCLIETATKTLLAGCQNSVIPTDGSVEIIAEYAFDGCENLSSITIPTGITNIGFAAFSSCSNLTSITIPSSVTSIDSWAFLWCEKLENIFVAKENETYHSEGNCLIETATKTLVIGLNNSVIPTDGSVTSIGKYAFTCCDSFTNIVIPSSVTSISSCAFSYCDNLTSIVIPAGVTSIGDNPFFCCDNFTIYCEAASQPSGWSSYWNYLKCPVVWDCNNNEVADDGNIYAVIDCIRYALKDGVATVARQPHNVVSITIPSSVTYKDNTYSVTSIGDRAFADCDSLTSIVIPASVTSIGDRAFYSCNSLTSIEIPSSVTSIGKETFCWCNYLSVTFEDPNGWYCTTTQNATSGTAVALTDASQNATYLKSTHSSYYWYKND